MYITTCACLSKDKLGVILHQFATEGLIEKQKCDAVTGYARTKYDVVALELRKQYLSVSTAEQHGINGLSHHASTRLYGHDSGLEEHQ